MSNDLITHYSHIVALPKHAEAKSLLYRVASRVHGLMKLHAFHVTTLAEFYPKQKNLLGTNMNRGHKISLRLRSSEYVGDFLSEDDIVGTMLHELVHIWHGPHDAKFYATLDDFFLEMETMTSKKRAAFDSPGVVLGGTGRKGTQILALGGTKPHSIQDLKSRVAEAAIRRARDARWCGTGEHEDPIILDSKDETPDHHEKSLQVVKEVQLVPRDVPQPSALSDGKLVIEILEDDEEDCQLVGIKQAVTKKERAAASQASDDLRMKKRGLMADSLYEHLKKYRKSTHVELGRPILVHGTWECGVCTLRNTLSKEQCAACHTERSSKNLKQSDYWTCEVCQLFNETDRWMCSRCHNIKTTS